ncbi:cobalamin-dependent protein [Polynucleobacter sp. MG-28-Ekke-A2]|uniref:cobalamin B12-binding domain-containing protein n=1 Tax=Polynucleobacter sp. MG-28-Ekke-A2 TaxID=3108276 RepID=UPI002B22CB50|nr:cobalamin-dependent protein [Polynucleobacter sp. MG-28-Ekke-A2]MEA9602070.1 cobalamin-dependent protein [Polynucleobacter sp. MG-28-Ekke-A2]
MDTLVKKELIREVFSTQLPRLIEEIERKVDKSTLNAPSNESWIQAPAAQHKNQKALNEEQVCKITELLLDTEEGAFELAITVLKTHGASINYIVLELIPEIAKKLGKQWEEDTLSFTEVSIGVGKLERAIHKLDYLFQATQLEKRQDKSILISLFPDSQHSLGALILSNFFTYSGWQVYRPANNGLNAIIHEIESKHHHVLGISISTYEQLQELPHLIKLLKGKSNNPQILVLIGGPLYNKSPEKFNHIQADVKAFTPEESVQKLDQHLSLIENNT